MTFKKVPEVPRGLSPKPAIAPSTTASWFPAESVEKQVLAGSGFTYRPGKIWLGRTATDGAEPVGWMDDRHVITVAGSRTGKGVSAIIPALCEYPHSVLVIDPKGENARITAARRGFGTTSVTGMMQDVYVLDPYDISGVQREYLATFDPLHGLSGEASNTFEEVGLIVDALVVSANPKDTHFDDSAKAFVEGLILHVLTSPRFEDRRTLGTVRHLLRNGDTGVQDEMCDYVDQAPDIADQDREKLKEEITAFEALLQDMMENPGFEGIISGAASGLLDLGSRERGSVLSTARRNLKFLDAPEMRACLTHSDHSVQLQDLKRAKAGMTVYVVLPSRLMKTHARWMRLLLNLTVARMEADPAPVAKDRPVLAILDEFPTLGHLQVIESAVGFMAGYGLKLWSIIQDLSQLKRDYPDSWETFLGNAGMLQCFGNADQTTLDYISRRLGEVEVIREVTNSTDTTTTGRTELSDFEKVARTADKTLGSLGLQNDTKGSSESTAQAIATSQNIQKAPLLTPDEVRRFTSRASGMQIIMLADYRPLYLRRTPYYEDAFFDGKYITPGQALVPK